MFKKQFEQIQKTLTSLSASQKMLVFSLVVIMVMTLLYWGKNASNSETEPLFASALTGDDLQRVTRVLKAENIPFEPSGDKILVPSEKKDYALAALVYQQAVPKNSNGNVEDILGKMNNPFAPESSNDRMFNEATQQRLNNIIGDMPGVSSAYVMMDPSHVRQIGGDVQPAATVYISMHDGSKADKRLAEAVAEMVAGTNANMVRSRVHIVIDGKFFAVKDRDPNMPDGEMADEQAQAEQHMEENIKRALPGFALVGDVGAVVHATIDAITLHQTQTKVDDVKSKPQKSESDNEKSDTTTPAAAEPGAQANTGQSLTATPQPSGGGTSTEKDHTTDQFQLFPSQTVSETSKPAGTATATSAAVTVPRSYYVNLVKQESKSDKAPDPKEVDAAFEKDRDNVTRAVMNAIELTNEKAVSVNMYYDTPLMMAVGPASTTGGASSSSTTIALGGHLKEIALGALALVSLFMVSSMVKKSAPVPVIAAAAVEPPGPSIIGRSLDIAGEVGESDSALDGVEMGDDEIKSQQMVEQVSTLVKENPDAAATMVKRWLNRT